MNSEPNNSRNTGSLSRRPVRTHRALEASSRPLSISPRARIASMPLVRILLLIVLLFNIAWISGFWILNRALTEPQVHADLMRHVARIETLLGQPDLTEPGTLRSLETEFQAATADLQQLDSLLPLGGHWPGGEAPTEHHLLRLAIDSTQAAQNIITVVPLLQPIQAQAAQALINAGAAPNPTAPTTRITLPMINRGQYYLDLARLYWSEAQQERRLLTPAAVSALHDPAASAFLTQFDHLAPTLGARLDMTSALLDWSPGALGVTSPYHLLLLALDPSATRSGGGRVWDYADLETSGGALVSGIHFKSAQPLDCPAAACGTQPIPPGYNWFPFNHGRFSLTDATLDPRLPTAAPLIERTYQLATGTRVDGVIVVLPGLFADLLRVTGPVTVRQGGPLTVTAANVEDLLAAEHEGWPTTGAPRATTPDLESLLTQAILSRTAGANAALQERLAAALTSATVHGDLSVYSNSPRVETALSRLGFTGDISTSAGDSLLLSDTNDGPAANNPLVTESIVDQVTLDAKGSATHDLTITYTYNTHVSWSGARPLQPYSDFVRLIAPKGASAPQLAPPCVAVHQSLGGLIVVGCQFMLRPGATLRLHAAWAVAAAAGSGERSYRLLVQRQPGASVAVTVSVVAPPGYSLSRPLTSPDMRLSGADPSTVTWTTRSLTQDALIGATMSAISG